MNAWRSVCGPTGLAISARRAIRRTIRAGREQAHLVLLAPRRVLPQVQLAGLAGQAAVSGQEPG
jgi:hypothetical protein